MVTHLIDELDFTPGTVTVEGERPPLSPLQAHYVREVVENDFGVDYIYFSGEFPSVYFKWVPDFQPERIEAIRSIHKKIWNQGKVPFLYVESPTEIRIYNCYDKPLSPKDQRRTLDDLSLLKKDKGDAADLAELKAVFGKVAIESGRFWKEKAYAHRLKEENRVENALIENLKITRQKLLEQGLPVTIIHDLLLRSLFILYLEDRGATDAAFYQSFHPKAISYFDILQYKEASYQLFAELERAFNGNLSPVSSIERDLVTGHHLKQLQECFWSKIEQAGQLQLFDWRIFDFSVIPIQLLSEIYEDFLEKEEGKEKKAVAGAFYTRHPLAEFILNEVLPYPSEGDTAYETKILDPACGSGIFLVESLNRLLDRWQAAHPKEQISFEVIEQIVLDNIFGIELQKEAIKVAAFSIYLAMLDRLEPKTLWQAKAFPYLIYDPDTVDDSKQGRNLFRMDSLQSGPFENIDYDLIIGNPPFKRGGLEGSVQKYLDKLGFASELVIAFLHRATVLCPNGKIALVSGSKPLLFNKLEPYQAFRKFLFNETYVEKIYNFSILRRVSKSQGRNLFASANSPVSVIFYTNKFPERPSSKLFYCAPKTTLKNRIIDGIAIDPTDIKYLPREECQKPDTVIWKVAMWGTERDYDFICNLLILETTLNDSIREKGWSAGVGFQSSTPKDKYNPEIKKMPHIPAAKIGRYFSSIDMCHDIDIDLFSRLGSIEAYYAPHLLIKSGQTDKRFCASYLDFDCSFRKTVFGIHSNDENGLKLLAAYLNSSLISYLLFLISAAWGIEREEIKPYEILQLPDHCFRMPENLKKRAIALVDKIITIKEQEFFNSELKIEAIEDEIEHIFWVALNLDEKEKVLIEDFLQFTLDSFYKKERSIAFNSVSQSDSRLYAIYLTKTINSFLTNTDSLTAWATTFNLSHRSPLNLIALHLNKDRPAGEIEQSTEAGIQSLLKEIEAYTYEEYSESIYYRKFIRYYKSDTIYIVKPNEKRFWSRSMGLNDADEIIAEILNG